MKKIPPIVDIRTASRHLDALLTRACAGEVIGVISNSGAVVLLKPIEPTEKVARKQNAAQKVRARK